MEAVLADAESQQVTDYWFLGCSPAGTGRRNILDRMDQLPILASSQRNWKTVSGALHQKLDLSRPSHLYDPALPFCPRDPSEINRMQELPLQILTEVEGIEDCGQSPSADKERELIHIGEQ